MQVSYGLPTHRVDRPAEFLTGDAIGELARAAEAAGFDAVYTTEHPFPGDAWLAHGGHHALDPMVALSFAAATTTSLRLHTNLFVPAYRNPFLAAKAVASLDVLSAGRVILGVGAGYLQPEFEALGVPFEDRNTRTDDAIVAMKAAWTGEPVIREGPGYAAPGNTALPRPVQRPHPPIWIGGNSRQAIRRAVELADGWSPFPTTAKTAARTHTAPLSGPDELAHRIGYLREYATSIGRTAPLDVIFIPEGLGMGRADYDPGVAVASCKALAEVGVTWVAVMLPGETRDEQLAVLQRCARELIPEVHPL
ncbi:MAG TPA: LLM class F420-dependent oxidoreductase [Acidimicrobiales bacterium]|jgi:probable F420-dependent oxidoreductase|nr:LLM class F420-dependent oxidoreductase [Acidimicrobiales bacterium]